MVINFKKIQNTLVVSMQGELDHHNADGIRDELDRRFEISGAKNIIFDLSELKFMDSSGLGIIIGRYRAASALGGRTCISVPQGTVYRLISLAGINKIIPLYHTVDDAVKKLKNA